MTRSPVGTTPVAYSPRVHHAGRHLLARCAVAALAAVGSGCGDSGETSTAEAPRCPGLAALAGTNLVVNPSFEDGTTLADEWIDESSTTGEPTYSLSTSTGVVDGARAQRVQYSGRDGDDGTKKVEMYQAPIEGVAPGETVELSMCLSGLGAGALVNAYAIIGVEAFTADRTPIADTSTHITAVEPAPREHTLTFTAPDGTSYLAVFLQAPEVGASSAIDIVVDDASLVIVG